MAASAGKASCEKSFSESHPTKGVSDDVAFCLDVGEFGTKLFNDESPSHDALSVESLADQILVVCKNFYFVTQKDTAILLNDLSVSLLLPESAGLALLRCTLAFIQESKRHLEVAKLASGVRLWVLLHNVDGVLPVATPEMMVLGHHHPSNVSALR